MVTVFVNRMAEFAGISGASRCKFNTVPVAGLVAEVPRCSPVKLAGAITTPLFVKLHVTVISSPGRAIELLNATFSGTKFGCRRTVAIPSGAERAKSSAREVWFSVLFSVSSATTHK
jgi:hypothetical protein